MTQSELYDPKGLVKEAFSIAGITEPECRSIFLDWVLGVPTDMDVQTKVSDLIRYYETIHTADHPMLITLVAARDTSVVPKRRGGRKSRIAGDVI